MTTDSIAFLNRTVGDPEVLQRFGFRETVIYCSIPSEHLPDASLPAFVASVATARGTALDQLIDEAGQTDGTCHYCGWIDQAVFVVRHSSQSDSRGFRELLPLLASDPIDQYGDACFCFVPEDLSFLSVIEVSRETRFVYMGHYCDEPTVHARLVSAR